MTEESAYSDKRSKAERRSRRPTCVYGRILTRADANCSSVSYLTVQCSLRCIYTFRYCQLWEPQPADHLPSVKTYRHKTYKAKPTDSTARASSDVTSRLAKGVQRLSYLSVAGPGYTHVFLCTNISHRSNPSFASQVVQYMYTSWGFSI